MIKIARLITIFFFCSILNSNVFAQRDNSRAKTYINQYKELAISEMLRTGIPASITLAQGILETAGGQSELAANANNHFGIKCKSEWTGGTYLYTDDAKNECFRKYASVDESYKDHSDFLKTRPPYAFLFKLDPTDYEGWAKGLKKAGYATSPSYSQSLIKTIVENNLQEITLLAMQRQDNGDDLFATVTKPEDWDQSKQEPVITKTIISNPEPAFEEPKFVQSVQADMPIIESPIIKKPNNYPFNAVFNINESKVIFVEGGTSLLALAANYNVAYAKLIEFNDLSPLEILPENQLIFLQKKPRKGSKEIHVVEDNETLHEIAQKEGVQLSAVLEYNNLKNGMQPAKGESIYLKSTAPSIPKLASLNTGLSNSGM